MRLKGSKMSLSQISAVVLLIGLTLISGLADAQGFVHAANIWQDGKPIWPELIKSALGFGLGIMSYWICIRFLQDFRVVSPEIQSLVWFTITILGVAFFSGKFLHWQTIDQIVGIAVLCGVAWLVFRTGG